MALKDVDIPVARVVSGRGELVAELFDRQYLPLCRLASLLLSDRGRAEDVVQEAFLRTFSGWGRLHDPDRVDAYVRRAVVNLCRSRLRRRSVEWRGNEAVWHRQARSASPDGLDPSAVVVLDAVRGLPRRQREAVVLHYFADLTQADVARAMGCTEGSVKSHLSKARANLARGIAPQEEREDA